jgi:tetratricopeptide (TPR) repeat protein
MADADQRLAAALAGRYRLERELGQGGMARVYLAEDLKHGRRVALKLLRPELAGMIGVDRFLAEIRTMAGLQHPRILPLFDSGLARIPAASGSGEIDLPYYVMPYVAGETLRARLARERQLPVPEALDIAIQVAAALDHAHRQGIVHRDIKPENILLHEGEAVVADFGIALALGAAATERLTEAGLALGTPVYMSPEQLLGERDIDGRSDLFALGCVLYEMLAGEPPHIGPFPQAIAAKRLSQAIPPVRTIRETVPPPVGAALARVLAKAPADRFATGREFAAALGGRVDSTPTPVRPHPHRRWGLPLAGAVAAVLLAAGIWLARFRHPPGPQLDSNRLAVAPFDVTGPGLEVWHEGLVDVLARTLDGAGSLRTVSPSVVLHGWAGRSDRASALTLGRRTGAGLVATGAVSRLGADRVRLRASILDVQADELLGEVDVEGSAAALGALADSLGLGILRTLSRTRPVAAVRQAAIGAAPLGALKAFLAGEQAYRRGNYDSALVAYQETLAQDSTFTLAMYRMAQVLTWDPPSADAFQPAEHYADAAFRRNHGLPARDSLMISAESLAWAVAERHPEYYAQSLARRQEVVRRFPGDPEAWLALGESRYHAPFDAQDLPGALEAFERAIQLDPGFGPPYEHVINLALRTGREDRAMYHARAAAVLRTTAAYSASVRLMGRLLLLPESERPEALAALDSVSAVNLYNVGLMFMWVPDPHETAVQLLRRLARRQVRAGESAEWVVDSLMRTRYVVMALVRRGHLREALNLGRADLAVERFGGWYPLFDQFSTLALFGVLPGAQAARTFAPALEPGAVVTDGWARRWQGLPWWAGRRDTASLALFQRHMRDAGSRGGEVADVRRAQYLDGAAGGYLALVRGDTATALRHFAALADTVYCGLLPCVLEKFTEAELLAARGEDRQAAAILDRWVPRLMGGLAVLGLSYRARIAERLGDLTTARRAYRHVADAWRHADPELAAYAAEAEAGLARVSRRMR